MVENSFLEPLATVDDAKAFFVGMGCSGFHMSREHPDRYEKFQRLDIPAKVQVEWRLEEFGLAIEKLDNAPDDETSWRFTTLVDLSDWSRAAQEELLEAARRILPRTPLPKLTLLAETFLGSSLPLTTRASLILRAYDTGYPDLASDMLQIVDVMLARTQPDTTKAIHAASFSQGGAPFG